MASAAESLLPFTRLPPLSAMGAMTEMGAADGLPTPFTAPPFAPPSSDKVPLRPPHAGLPLPLVAVATAAGLSTPFTAPPFASPSSADPSTIAVLLHPPPAPAPPPLPALLPPLLTLSFATLPPPPPPLCCIRTHSGAPAPPNLAPAAAPPRREKLFKYVPSISTMGAVGSCPEVWGL